MLNYGIKLWSINEDLFDDTIKAVQSWYFDFIELYVIPWKFQKESLQVFIDHNVKISIHAPHGMHWFNPIDWENNSFEIWEEVKKYIDFLSPFQIVIHPEFWKDVEILKSRLNIFNDTRIIIENMPKKSSIIQDLQFYWYSLENIEEIKKFHNWFCFDFAKAKSSANSQWVNIINFSDKMIATMNNSYFHISWFMKDTEVDEHFDIWEWENELMKYMKNKLFEIWCKKDIFIVFECKKKDWVKNDLKNLDFFKKL